ncbi:MAG: hypothetical protein ACREQ4_14080 [Candidatus Binataceae bacterium]
MTLYSLGKYGLPSSAGAKLISVPYATPETYLLDNGVVLTGSF